MLSGRGRWQPAPTRNSSQDEAVDRLTPFGPLIRLYMVLAAARGGHVERQNDMPTDPIPDKTSTCKLYKGNAPDLLILGHRLLIDGWRRSKKHHRPMNRPFDFVPKTVDR